MRFLLNDWIHTLIYEHIDIIRKVESEWEGPEIFIMSADEAKSKGQQPARPFKPDMRETRAPMISVWQNRRKEAFEKDRKRLKEGVGPIKPDSLDDVSYESSEEDAISLDKTPLSSQPTTSLTLSVDLKPSKTSTTTTF